MNTAIITRPTIEVSKFPDDFIHTEYAGKFHYSLSWYCVLPKGRKAHYMTPGFFTYKTMHCYPLYAHVDNSLRLSPDAFKKIVSSATVKKSIASDINELTPDIIAGARAYWNDFCDCQACGNPEMVCDAHRKEVDSGKHYTPIVIK